nr:uncharacterized protein LOC111510535 isoform X1 [Leptinotarsa decemlineata]XP_023022223.1 uncharacterized protein LOC111510535 isoform X1 [Leptinotarsa decemlineata]
MGKNKHDLEDTSDDEFVVETDTAVEEATTIQRLKEFSFYLVENIELNLNLFLKLLEERDVPAKQNSLYVTGLSLALKAIPKIGTGASGALSSGEKWMLNKIDKKSSRTLAEIVYYYSDNKETFRKILIESAVDIFYSFEDQFRKLSCKGGEKRAMQKLAKDAVDRIFYYFLETEQKRDVTRDEVTKGVIYGESRRNLKGIRQGNEVQNNEIKWKTCKLYTKVGIVLVDEHKFYRGENTHTKKYGHRRLFPWENSDDIKKTWYDDDFVELPKYTLNIKDDLIKSITEYIMSKNTFEEAKLERLKYSEQAASDREEKQEEVLQALADHFKDMLDEMEVQFQEIAVKNRVDNSLLEEISKKQDQGNSSQAEIIVKLGEIHSDVTETKHVQIATAETTEAIRSEVIVIKSNQEEMAGAMVRTEQVEEIVKSQTKDNVKDSLKDVIRDTLRENDPGPKIHAEIDRAAERLKKNVPRELKKFEQKLRKLF